MSILSSQPFSLNQGDILHVRSADPLDAVAIQTLKQAVAGEGRFIPSEPEEIARPADQEAAWIRAQAAAPNGLTLVADRQGDIVGLLDFRGQSRHRLTHHGDFGLFVARAWRGRGVGSALLDRCLTWAQAHPIIEKVWLTVFADNAPAIALYRRHGFQEEGRMIRAVKMGPRAYLDELAMATFVKPFPPDR